MSNNDEEKNKITISRNDIEGALMPAANQAVNNFEQAFKVNRFDEVYKKLNETKENLFKDFDKYKNEAFSKINKYHIFEKIMGKATTLFEVKGIGVGVLDIAFFGKSVIKIWIEKDYDFSTKLNEIGRTTAKAIGSLIVGGILGSAFSVFGPLGTFFGTLVGSKLGELIAGGLYKLGEAIFAGIKGLFQSGGVEFIFPKTINGFKSNFIFNKYNYIAFEYNDDNNFDISQILDLVNSKFLIGNIKVKNINEIYDTILKEIAYGFLYKKELLIGKVVGIQIEII
jgi:hypothetical protein